MKAHWDAKVFGEMERKPLPFTDLDVELIQRSLETGKQASQKSRIDEQVEGSEAPRLGF